MPLGAIGVIKYGSGTSAVTFSGYISSKVRATPRWDDAGLTIVAVDYVLTVNAPINTGIAGGAPDGDINSLMSQWQKTLLTPGLPLYYSGVGLGLPFNVQVPGGLASDADWGPKPQVFEFTPLGGGGGNMVGARVVWQVRFTIPVCPGKNKYVDALMALNYGVSWSIDHRGFTTRSIQGYLEIPLSRMPNSRKFFDTADSYRERIQPPFLYGFRRTQQFSLSANKKRLDFTITDTELPVALPPGVAEGTAEHTLESSIDQRGGGFTIWTGTISANFTMVKDSKTQKQQAFDRFMLLVNDRIGHTKKRLAELPAADKATDASVMLHGFSVRENIFDLSSSFTVRYTMIGLVNFKKALDVAGLWTVNPKFNDGDWTRSMAEAFGVRGLAQLRDRATNGIIVDLCASQQPSPRQIEADAAKKNKKPRPPEPVKAAAPEGLDGKKSWLWFRNNLQLIEKDRVVRHKPLNSAPQVAPLVGQAAYDLLPNWAKKLGTPIPSATSKVPDIVQRISSPSITIRMHGSAARVVDRVPIPYLRSVNGIPATLLHQQSHESTIGGIFGAAINYLEWDQYYLLPIPPGQMPSLSNPVFNYPGSSNQLALPKG